MSLSAAVMRYEARWILRSANSQLSPSPIQTSQGQCLSNLRRLDGRTASKIRNCPRDSQHSLVCPCGEVELVGRLFKKGPAIVVNGTGFFEFIALKSRVAYSTAFLLHTERGDHPFSHRATRFRIALAGS